VIEALAASASIAERFARVRAFPTVALGIIAVWPMSRRASRPRRAAEQAEINP